MEAEFKCKYKVQYKDIDSNFKLKLVSALQMFQESSMEHGESVNQGIEYLYKKGITWISLGWNISVIKMPQYLETVYVSTWTNSSKAATALRQFKMVDENGNVLILAEDKFAVLNIEKRKIIRIPPELMEKYVVDEGRVIDEDFPQLKENPEYAQTSQLQIRISDLDTNKHVNNLNYFEYALNVIPMEEQNKIKNIKINYKKEIQYIPYCTVSSKKVDNIYKIKISDMENKIANCLIEVEI